MSDVLTGRQVLFEKMQAGCPSLERAFAPRTCCIAPDVPPELPDPWIFSQRERFSKGRSVSWDNPHITTNVSSPSRLDEFVTATVQNGSPDAAAAGVDVRFEYSRFGIGFQRDTFGMVRLNLNKSGLPGSVRTVKAALPSDPVQNWERVAVFVSVEHPYDRDASNNQGEQAWSRSGATIGGGGTFAFQIRNNLPTQQVFGLEVIGSEWNASLDKASVSLVPGGSDVVTLSVAVPTSANQSRSFNVIALREDGTLYGGLFHRFDATQA